jgi:hypothetical protein
MKNAKYFIVWVEGLNLRTGEKIKSIKGDVIEYTTKMTEAMRFPVDREDEVSSLLKEYLASWVVESPNTYHQTTYAPKGTMWKGC